MWKSRSLRFWIACSLIMALAPLTISAGVGYVLLNRGVIGAFQDVADRQRTQVIPAQRLRLLVSDALVPVDEFIEDGQTTHQAAYRSLRTAIETGFATLDDAMRGEPAARSLVQRARGQWEAADRYATGLISVTDQSGNGERLQTLQRFHGTIAAVSDDLEAVYDQIAVAIEDDHDSAALIFERSEWVAGIAGGVSLLCVVLGVLVIGRVMSSSVDRLVDGAIRFSEGDRTHRIDVQVPPELHRVAEEFNHMIGRIHESEAALADLAHQDSLTGLSNRRAFDESLAEMWARVDRFGERGALLAIDIDHFKRVNDTHGHAAGDEVLRVVARTLQGQLRSFDKIFRTGGEEFAVVLPGTNGEAARGLAERLRQAIADTTIRFKDVEINVTISVGCAFSPDVPELAVLVECADAALYKAKVGGRNRVVIYGEEGAERRGVA